MLSKLSYVRPTGENPSRRVPATFGWCGKSDPFRDSAVERQFRRHALHYYIRDNFGES